MGQFRLAKTKKLSGDNANGQMIKPSPIWQGVIDIRLLGLGLYWAWLFITYYTPVFFPTADAAANLAREAWSWGAWAHTLALIACAFLGKHFERLSSLKSLIVVCACLSFAGSAFVPISQYVFGFHGVVSQLLSAAGSIITGCTAAWIVVLYGKYFSRLSLNESLLNMAAAYLVSCAIYFLVLLFSEFIAVATVIILQPFAALVLLCFSNKNPETEKSDAAPTGTLRINLHIIIPLFTIFFFAAAGEMFRGFADASGEAIALVTMGNLYMAGGVIGLVALGIAFAFTVRRGRGNIINFKPVLIVMAFSFLCTILFGTSYAVAYAVFGAAFMACRCIVWAYSSEVVRRTKLQASSVFGISQASFALAVVVGVPLTQQLSHAVQAGEVQWASISATFLFFIVVITVLASNSNDLESAWGLVPKAAVFADSAQSDTKGRLHDGVPYVKITEDNNAATDSNRSGEFTSLQDAGKKANGAEAAEEVISADAADTAYAADAVTKLLQEKFDLTPRECEVAALLARGRSLPFVQKELHISQGTAQSHLVHIYRKMGVHSRQEFIDVLDKEVSK